jgi:hypothetical protein
MNDICSLIENNNIRSVEFIFDDGTNKSIIINKINIEPKKRILDITINNNMYSVNSYHSVKKIRINDNLILPVSQCFSPISSNP